MAGLALNGGQRYVRRDRQGQMEFLPIHQDFIPYQAAAQIMRQKGTGGNAMGQQGETNLEQ